MTPIRTVFMGSGVFSVPALRAMTTRGESLITPLIVVGIVTQPDRPAGRGRKISAPAPKLIGHESGITVLQPPRVRAPDSLQTILDLDPDLIVVASFGQLLPPRLLDAPRLKCLNLHPSLLPRYRGPSPLFGPILAGDMATGTSVMLMTAGMDEGPILAQARTPIAPHETAGDLEARLAGMSAALLLDTIPSWVKGEIDPKPQDDSLATYTTLVRKEDGRIDWRLPADMLSRQVRAFNPWPAAHTYWSGKRLRLLRASAVPGNRVPGIVVRLENRRPAVGTGDGLLRLDEVQPAGARAMTGGELLSGYPGLVGSTLG